ncbi:hypothetical protein [Desulfobulbus sp.]|uniref:hypothetical protein n=1 Tax=Desulfobulbus sp. TaxID=895 RepID=UPI00286ECDF8|nr:hypothetical protein [Desulfobulbus sp.]
MANSSAIRPELPDRMVLTTAAPCVKVPHKVVVLTALQMGGIQDRELFEQLTKSEFCLPDFSMDAILSHKYKEFSLEGRT